MPQSLAIQVVDLAFGDCGKGSIVDYLARQCPDAVVVRFNGGPQAGHNVVTGGRHHTFSQFGAGSFIPGVRSVLSRFILIEPYAMFNEARHLQGMGLSDIWRRLVIDRRCPVITPAHQAANRLRELARGSAAHGTCGMGIGETALDLRDHPDVVPSAGELGDRSVNSRKLGGACDLKADQLRGEIAALRGHPAAEFAIATLTDRSWLDAALDNYAELARRAQFAGDDAMAAVLSDSGTIIFEGAQGVLLDEHAGFHPHTTWSTTTFAYADRLLDEWGHQGRRYRLGVLRSYFTRHGPGPFVTEDESLRPLLPEAHNASTGWQGRFRVGLFDAVAARYALAATGAVDGLALTHLDRLAALSYRLCRSYRDDGEGDAAYFTRDNQGRITDMPVHRNPDLALQKNLTALLHRCRSADTHAAGSTSGAFVDEVERQLSSRVVLTSSGPGRGTKREGCRYEKLAGLVQGRL